MNWDYIKNLFEEDNGGNDDNNGGDNNAGNNNGGDKGNEGKTFSEEEVNAIISKRFERWKKEQEKAEEEAKRLASMSAAEKAEAERDALQKKIDELLKRDNRNQMERSAKTVLAGLGYKNVPDELIAQIITDDADTTKTACEAFAKYVGELVSNAVKERLPGTKQPAGGSESNMSKEEILAIEDPIERQKKIRENIKLFKQ